METEPSNNIVDDLVEDENKSLEPAEIQKSAEETLAPEETLKGFLLLHRVKVNIFSSARTTIDSSMLEWRSKKQSG